jgi:hypothetical protein
MASGVLVVEDASPQDRRMWAEIKTAAFHGDVKRRCVRALRRED